MARSAVGCGRYVPTQGRFGKGLAQSFFQFCDAWDRGRYPSIFPCVIKRISICRRYLRATQGPARGVPADGWRSDLLRTSSLLAGGLAIGSVTREPPPT
jgi:hypothetical protein